MPDKKPITLADLRAKRDEIIRLAEQRGAYNVRVFGSVARGESSPDSDVDLLISVNKGVDMFTLVGLWLDLQEFLGCDVSLVEDKGMSEIFSTTIQGDVITL